jgi:hypothetical protein
MLQETAERGSTENVKRQRKQYSGQLWIHAKKKTIGVIHMFVNLLHRFRWLRWSRESDDVSDYLDVYVTSKNCPRFEVGYETTAECLWFRLSRSYCNRHIWIRFTVGMRLSPARTAQEKYFELQNMFIEFFFFYFCITSILSVKFRVLGGSKQNSSSVQ